MSNDSRGITLIEALILIALEKRSGELVIESGNNIGSLVFYEGRILLAFSPYTRAIGDLLVEKGVLTDGELLDVLKQQRTGPHTPVGTLLLKTGKVSFDNIQSMVQDQIRMAVGDFLSWKNIDCNFVVKDIQPFDSINLPVYEFLPQETVHALLAFTSDLAHVTGTVLPPSP